MPPPGLQIYVRLNVTLTFDLLTSKVDRFMHVLGPLTTCAKWHQNRFIRLQNNIIIY